jgi:hypothetical protein
LLVLGTATTARASANPIPAENLRAGTAQWLAAEAPPPLIEGYSSSVSTAPGETISFHVSTNPAASYRIVIYRLGWYGGTGGTLVTCLPSCDGHFAGSPQAVPPPFGVLGEVRADWPASTTLTIPAGWVSGYYVAHLLLTSGPGSGTVDRVPVIVREAVARRSQVLAMVPVNTWQAYNGWGGKSLYPHSSIDGRPAAAVSFDRPYFIGAGRQEMTDWEIALVRWLEREGYDLSYQTDVDTHRDPAGLRAHRLVLTLGHGEYWTKEMRDGFEAARAAGTNLGFLGANTAYWQVRYTNSERTMIGYKSLYDPEPVVELKTALFREIGRPECALLGVQHQGGLQDWRRHDYVVTAAGARDPWAVGSGLVEGSRIENVVSVERDTVPSIGCGYPTVLFRYDAGGETLGDAAAVRYTAESGARVFSAGTMELGWALDSYPGAVDDSARVDPRLQRFMVNAMEDLIRPAPPRTIGVLATKDDVRVTIHQAHDPRIGWEVYRRAGADEAPLTDPAWERVCRATNPICIDRYAPPGDVRYAVVSYDAWARSAPVLSSPFAIPRALREWRASRGAVIAVSRERQTPTRPRYDLVLIALATGRAHTLTRGLYDQLQPTWSFDGRRLAVTTDRFAEGSPPSPSSESFVSIINRDGSHRRRIALGRSPTWSPDGRSLALERRGSIFIVDLATRRQRRLVRGRNPSWSRHGLLAFEDEAGIWTIRPSGRRVRLLARPDPRPQPASELVGSTIRAYAQAPTWSPDGSRIAFTNARAVDGDISTDLLERRVHVIRSDGRDRRAYVLDVARATWSPGGRWLVGARDDGRLCMTRITRPKAVTCPWTVGKNFDPAWRPLLAPPLTSRGARLRQPASRAGKRGRR